MSCPHCHCPPRRPHHAQKTQHNYELRAYNKLTFTDPIFCRSYRAWVWWNAYPGLCSFAPLALLYQTLSLQAKKSIGKRAAERWKDHSPGQARPPGQSAALGKTPTRTRSPSGATENAFSMKSTALQQSVKVILLQLLNESLERAGSFPAWCFICRLRGAAG